MNWKEFLKPDWKKMLIFLLLTFFVGIIIQNHMSAGNVVEQHYLMIPYPGIIGHAEGTIIHRTVICGIPIAPPNCNPESSFRFDYFGLVFNLIFWYLISCTIIYAYKKVKK